MKLVVDGQLVECNDSGSGRVVLLLHGWGVNSKNFDKLSKHLAVNFRVISFDFPGFGGSEIPACDWNVSDYAKVTKSLLDKLKINELYAVIGHSFGGRVIIKGISDGAFNPGRVILMGSAGVKPKTDAKKSIYKVIAKTGKAAMSLPIIRKYEPAIKKRFYKNIGNSDYLNSGKLKQIFLNTINEDLLPLVSNVNQPSLLIWGKQDFETPVADAEKILAQLKNGKLEIIDGAGHFVHIDQSEKVNKLLDEFLL